MTLRSLQTVLRSLTDLEVEVGDSEMLRRFVAGEESAFAELVRRHGRLVWAVCRNLTGSEAAADDAFQATFLVLLRNAHKIRDGGKISAWLHGVAYRVCAKARQAAKRRTRRERATATSERNGSTVADSAWDRALAAVHEEAGKLPETLRIPFVLCCLEGKGASEAAAQLGWKLGTLSGRLTRAKDALLARLEARGMTLGAVASIGLASPPATALARASALTQVGAVVPASILQLSQGVLGMSMSSFKVLAAAVLVTCGLGLSAGSGWVATADAQAPGKVPPPATDPEARVKQLRSELEKALMEAEAAAKKAQTPDKATGQYLDYLERHTANAAAIEAIDLLVQKRYEEAASAKTSKWEYDFVLVSDMTQTKFVELLQDREHRGWEYNGTTTYRHEGKPASIWVFRRPVKAAAPVAVLGEYYQNLARSYAPATRDPTVLLPKKPEDAKAIEAEIVKLQEQLAALKTNPSRNWSRVLFPKNDLPLEPVEMMAILSKLAEKKFGKGSFEFSASSHGVALESDKEVIGWVSALVKKLSEK